MTHYYYKCSICDKEFSAADIEKNGHYLCPACGRTEENQPLRGVLTVLYDYDLIKKKIDRKKMLGFSPGVHYLYPELWPLDYTEPNNLTGISNSLLHRLSLPSNSFYTVRLNGNIISVLDETHNPTFSYKDRASILVALKALQRGISDISVASTGNAGSSMAGICAMTGLTAHVWVPEKIPREKLAQIVAYGANAHIVAGSYDDAFDLNTLVCNNQNWLNRNTAFNPLTIEGKKSAAYDIFISTQGEIPDQIFVPVGDGAIIGGLYKGFSELVQLGWINSIPQLISVQAEGCNPVCRFIDTGHFAFKESETISDSINAAVPRNLFMATQAVKDSNGFCVSVSDKAILTAQKKLIAETGILVEPSAAATYAGYEESLTQEKITGDKKVMILLTGNGLKDMKSLTSGLVQPEVKGISQWKELFVKN